MSHNSHFILVKAENEEQAEFEISNDLNNFGDENNWWSIRNVWNLETQKKEINNALKFLNEQTSQEKFNTILEHINELQQRLSGGDNNSFIYYEISQYYKTLYEISSMKKSQPITADSIFDTNDFYGWQFDEFGFTNMAYDNEDEENCNTYLIEIDMHS